MGLLDDAIREHLELKRRRGADPGEVARAQREALEPVPGEEMHASGGDIAVAEELAPSDERGDDGDPAFAGSDGSAQMSAEPMGDDLGDAPSTAHSSEPSNAIQETAELDMQTVLDEHEDGPVAEAGEHLEEDSLEWEVPGDATARPETDRGHDEHHAAAMADLEESAEHVPEETPDFLRDTPEQDRLWSERRPPRDFGSDK